MEITYEDFRKVQIHVGTVLSVKNNEKARQPALVLEVDFGAEIGIKLSSAKITHYYNLENLIGRQIIAVCNFPTKNIAGIVSEAAERMSKKGNHFGILTVEDYTDAGKFFLFGDSYLKFRRFLVEGAFLYIKGKVEPKRYNKHEFEFKIHHIELLSEVRDKMVKSVTLHINSNAIDETYIAELAAVCKANAGPCGLNVVLINDEERIVLDLKSNAYQVEITNEFIEGVRKLPQLELKLN